MILSHHIQQAQADLTKSYHFEVHSDNIDLHFYRSLMPTVEQQRFEIWNKISVIKNIIGFVANYQIIFALFLSKRW